MIMNPMPYMLTLHYIVLAMREVTFPITKAELLEKVGDKMIRTGPDSYTPFSEIIKKMPMDEFSCAAEFYCNHSAS
ncbi:MAG: hypothetical protein KIG21_02610 [Angelakisella sp.]|nr:hypothetical protein [Angelakisella sp.]MBS7324266.1 hypothetical protein [Angelakisella sp.]